MGTMIKILLDTGQPYSTDLMGGGGLFWASYSSLLSWCDSGHGMKPFVSPIRPFPDCAALMSSAYWDSKACPSERVGSVDG